ncbi:MAG: N-formylglutamate deformylase [Gammaproteobacteria bacterium]|nr:N-formylglutamate deformylase [Gammaproteobacteria bacterium]MBT8111777.1 N-formylglutamate deformylase [Gammaproteobacteria bacterium]NND47175.1 N-formylglutamate deformylase [Woeseiaceae bacterium]NNL46476.1 N-formylglutamate deformylase [Woeseiaceae bacterium]
MIAVCNSYEGELPLLISVPHDGCHVPKELQARMTKVGLTVPDTDWHVAELYDFARELGASMQVANYSRYVVDLNRSASDDVLYPGQLVTGLCPEQTFSGEDIYSAGGVTAQEKAERIVKYWQPYHARIDTALVAMRAKHGYALLWDAHSIPSAVPRLFDGDLPELNIGTNDGRSCAAPIERAVVTAARASGYSVAVNQRFKGGYITRHYGSPDNGVHAIQLEIAQRTYMDEATTVFDAEKARRLRAALSQLLQALLEAARDRA